jgi:VWFA-related protein
MTRLALAALGLQIAYSLSTSLVVVPVTITDTAGQPVTSLPAAAFRIQDEGRDRSLSLFTTESPATFVLLVDRSASTQPKTQMLVEGVQGFLADGDPLDEVWLQTFNEVSDRARIVRSPAAFHEVLQQPAAGGTAAYDALTSATQSLQEAGHSRRVVILMSDGNDTESRSPLRSVQSALRHSGAMLFFAKLDADAKSTRSAAAISELAAESGGASLALRNPVQAHDELHRLRSGLRHQYVLGFTSDATGRVPRRIKVSISRSNLRVRARQYYVPDLD